MSDEHGLREEAAYLYMAFFGEPCDQMILERYVQAHAQFNVEETDAGHRMLDVLQRHRLNAEAVEYVMRLKSRKNMLTLKVGIILFLAECQRCRIGDFFPDSNSGATAWLGILRAFFRALWCFVRGHYLMWKHGLA